MIFQLTNLHWLIFVKNQDIGVFLRNIANRHLDFSQLWKLVAPEVKT